MIHTVEEALQGIEEGKLIVVATDTVLGIIADGSNEKAVTDLYALKKRDKRKSAVILLKGQASVATYAQHIPAYAQKFMDAFWPGALSLVFIAKSISEAQTYLANPDSVSVRVPNEPHLLELLGRTTKTIISTSANVSGEEPCASLAEAADVFGEAALYWDYGTHTHASAVTSTVVDVRNREGWQILREGAISKEMLWHALDKNEK